MKKSVVCNMIEKISVIDQFIDFSVVSTEKYFSVVSTEKSIMNYDQNAAYYWFRAKQNNSYLALFGLKFKNMMAVGANRYHLTIR